jgi:hypothetical protein
VIAQYNLLLNIQEHGGAMATQKKSIRISYPRRTLRPSVQPRTCIGRADESRALHAYGRRSVGHAVLML